MPTITTDNNTNLDSLATALQNSDATSMRAGSNSLIAKTGLTARAGKLWDQIRGRTEQNHQRAENAVIAAYTASAGGVAPSPETAQQIAAAVRGNGNTTMKDLVTSLQQKAAAQVVVNELDANVTEAAEKLTPDDVFKAAEKVISQPGCPSSRGPEVFDAIRKNPNLSEAQKKGVCQRLTNRALQISAENATDSSTFLRNDSPEKAFVKSYLTHLSQPLAANAMVAIDRECQEMANDNSMSASDKQAMVGLAVASTLTKPDALSPELKETLEIIHHTAEGCAVLKPSLGNGVGDKAVNATFVLGALNPALSDAAMDAGGPDMMTKVGGVQAYGLYHSTLNTPGSNSITPAVAKMRQDLPQLASYQSMANSMNPIGTPVEQAEQKAVMALDHGCAIPDDGERVFDAIQNNASLNAQEKQQVINCAGKHASKQACLASTDGGNLARLNSANEKFLSHATSSMLKDLNEQVKQTVLVEAAKVDALGMLGGDNVGSMINPGEANAQNYPKQDIKGLNAAFEGIAEKALESVVANSPNVSPEAKSFLSAVKEGAKEASLEKSALLKDGSANLTPDEVGDKMVQAQVLLRSVNPAINNAAAEMEKSPDQAIRARGKLVTKATNITQTYDSYSGRDEVPRKKVKAPDGGFEKNPDGSDKVTWGKRQDASVDAIRNKNPVLLQGYRSLSASVTNPVAVNQQQNLAPQIANQQNVSVNQSNPVAAIQPAVVAPSPLPVSPPQVAEDVHKSPRRGSVLAALQSPPKPTQKADAKELSFGEIQNKFGGSVAKKTKDSVSKDVTTPVDPASLGKSKGLGGAGG